MGRPKKAAPEILTPEQIEEKCDVMDAMWQEVYDRYHEALVAGDDDRAGDLHMIAVVMCRDAKAYRREQEQILRTRAQRVHTRRRKPVVPKNVSIPLT